VLIYHSQQSREHRPNVALRITNQNEAGDSGFPAHHQLAETFVFGHQHAAFPPRALEDGTIASASRSIPHRENIMTGVLQSLDQTAIQAFVGEEPHAASGRPNSMSSLRR
jgi:hypothetical protein